MDRHAASQYYANPPPATQLPADDGWTRIGRGGNDQPASQAVTNTQPTQIAVPELRPYDIDGECHILGHV